MKKFLISIIIILFFCTVFLCIKKPPLHKSISINILDYFVKIDKSRDSATIIEKSTIIDNTNEGNNK